MEKKVVLAFSGGLDTSVILAWLIEKGYEVITYTADVGQIMDPEKIKEKALSIGASKAYVVDLKKEFVEDFAFKALKADAKYEGRYLLGTALARPVIAKHQVGIAIKEDANALAHGCTGKGNDQVRFELAWLKFMPDVEIVSPWKDPEFLGKFEGRSDLIKYAKEHNIPVEATPSKPFSVDENIMHTSYESGIIEDLSKTPSKESFKGFTFPEDAPDSKTELAIEFEKGIPVFVEDITNGNVARGSVEIMEYLNKVGAENGIGVLDMVENRFIGIKSRGIYIAPGASILWKAHLDLEGITLPKGVLHTKLELSHKIASLIYNGFWFSQEMEFLMAAIEKSQEKVSGNVRVSLYKGNVAITGRSSPNSLYNSELASMEKQGRFNPMHAAGFIRTMAIPYLAGVGNENVGDKQHENIG